MATIRNKVAVNDLAHDFVGRGSSRLERQDEPQLGARSVKYAKQRLHWLPAQCDSSVTARHPGQPFERRTPCSSREDVSRARPNCQLRSRATATKRAS